eukprot:4466863-Pleurochrysis_carterae.AAC.5
MQTHTQAQSTCKPRACTYANGFPQQGRSNARATSKCRQSRSAHTHNHRRRTKLNIGSGKRTGTGDDTCMVTVAGIGAENGAGKRTEAHAQA